MMRRFNAKLPSRSLQTQTQNRQYTGVWSIMCTLGAGWAITLCFSHMANLAANVSKYGRFRFAGMIDDSKVIEQFTTARFAGGFFGIFVWWNYIGAFRYHWSDMEKTQPRFGPF